jgi:hypothetical protein
MLIPAVGLLQGLRLPPYTPVLDLERKLRQGGSVDQVSKPALILCQLPGRLLVS